MTFANAARTSAPVNIKAAQTQGINCESPADESGSTHLTTTIVLCLPSILWCPLRATSAPASPVLPTLKSWRPPDLQICFVSDLRVNRFCKPAYNMSFNFVGR
jgi:hypothetical protein